MTKSAEQYAFAFDMECANSYPSVDRVEARLGFKLDRERLEKAARVLACPVKMNPPNWQHGRLIYSLVRHRLSQVDGDEFNIVDIGTAKGFSALCAQWALLDAKRSGQVFSTDVVGPDDRVTRNTVAEIERPLTLWEILEPWPEARMIRFHKGTGAEMLQWLRRRVHFAFVDGRHTYEAVAAETELLMAMQVEGDVILYDDYHMPGVARAVRDRAGPYYDLTPLYLSDIRGYCMAVRR